ncbi:CAMK family protein kinase [Histomonas meleagridis]|uniref:CAMK family protein kinase n=1 Tax=Histomonas meleagridis TaxID=135588 RepID=UPI003559D8A2|nr:CAMK family protein kinase [Histomonas meleagridis]KAH0799059.1 CAMK family protein kinase [Histomonas meleagridis]
MLRLEKILDEHGYDLGEKVGYGSFSKVFKVFSRNYKQIFVAKIIERNYRQPEKQCKQYEREVNSLMTIFHPNVISIYDHFECDEAMFLILEYCNGGTIDGFVAKNGPPDDKTLARFCSQIIQALLFCHSNEIAHRDLKPSNIFIDQYGRIKLADFGLADLISNATSTTSMTGTKAFLPPEAWYTTQYDLKLGDIWALGVTFYFLATGEYPWDFTSAASLENSIRNADFSIPDKVSKPFADIINCLLQVDPLKRMPLQILLQQDFFSQNVMPPPEKSIFQTPHLLSARTKVKRKSFIEPLVVSSSCKVHVKKVTSGRVAAVRSCSSVPPIPTFKCYNGNSKLCLFK